MAEGTYEYELERAELLGVAPPDRATWEKTQKERFEQMQEEQEIAENAEIAQSDETLQGTSGKLDELNSILANTQKKLNTKFKVVCGGLTSLMKFRPMGSASNINEEQAPATESASEPENNVEAAASGETSTDSGTPKRSVRDIGHKVARQVDVLDSLLAKSERAELAMHEQNKEMKRHLK